MNQDPRPRAFLDASALYPALLRNILMRLALRDLFRAFWSERVQDEWTRAVMRNRTHLSFLNRSSPPPRPALCRPPFE